MTNSPFFRQQLFPAYSSINPVLRIQDCIAASSLRVSAKVFYQSEGVKSPRYSWRKLSKSLIEKSYLDDMRFLLISNPWKRNQQRIY